MLYQYLKEKNINFNNCGKYIVATNEEEEDTLESIVKRHGLWFKRFKL